MASNIASAAMWAAVFTPTADEIAKEIVAEEARLREIEEKAYWEGWDKGCKEKVIQRLRDPNDEFTFTGKTYPEVTNEMWADYLERGELKLLAPLKEPTGIAFMWVDETREEAQREGYKVMIEK
ncbi:hypothetical protein, partial [Helicobacter sp.]|uniref:hypothetical protein n=1 Tax=Helicobacter sp. TaxID=218 RepID=UPI003753D066|nr:hypothetical protein [Helicobacter sp.]